MTDWTDYVSKNLRLPALPPGRECEIVEDVARQLDDAYQDALAAGLSPQEGRAVACQHITDWDEFSRNIAERERSRMLRTDRWAADASARSVGNAWFGGFWTDLISATRTLRRSPAFSLLATSTIAVGVAATVVTFSVLYSALWASLPYHRPQELVSLAESNPKDGVVAGAVSAANFYDWQAQNQCFSGMAAYSEWNFNLTGVTEPERIHGAIVSADFFSVLEATPDQGRIFRPDEEETGKSDVVVVSDRFWRRIFGTAALASQAVTLNGSKMAVVGIMPGGFTYPNKEVEIWVPLSLSLENRQNRQGRWLQVVARMKPGTSFEAVQQNMDVISQRLQSTYPASNLGWTSHIVSLRESQVGRLRRPLILLQAGVAFLFLTACFNIAGLMIARATQRQAEFATRLALGAGGLRMVRPFFFESMLFAACGGTTGILLATAAISLLRRELEQVLPSLERISLHPLAVALGALLTITSLLICGLVPAFHSFRVSRLGHGRAKERSSPLRQSMVAVQVTFAVTLAVGAMACLRSFVRLVAVDPGFNPRSAVAIDLAFAKTKYRSNEQQVTVLHTVLEEIRGIPGVLSAGAISDLPLRGNSMSFRVLREQDRDLPPEKLPQAGVRWVTADYFSAMQIRLLHGRFLDGHDVISSPLAAVVNRSFAQRFWPTGDALGKSIRLADDPRWFSIVGVVDDVKQLSLSQDEVVALYLPYAQKSQQWLNWATMVVRSSISSEPLIKSIRLRIRSIDSEQPISKVEILDQVINDEITIPRFAATLSGAFSALAFLLAVIGLAAIVAFAVTQRTHELAIRIALGADRYHIMKLVMKQATRSALGGIAMGLLASVFLLRLMENLLYGLRDLEPAILAQVCFASLLLILLACYVPALRVTHIEPIASLHYE